MPHKRISTAIEAFNRLRRPLVVVGDGPDARRLRRMAGPTVKFVGRVDDARVAQLLAGCRALVVTANEEFGIAAVEAQAAGRPVIGLAAGGLVETVRDGSTGVLWTGGPEELASTVVGFDEEAIDPADCVANAQRFGVERFRQTLSDEVERAMEQAPPEVGHEGRRSRPAPRPSKRGLGRRLR
jgi:glycosyltransferase involved in cell wall biosynthesis